MLSSLGSCGCHYIISCKSTSTAAAAIAAGPAAIRKCKTNKLWSPKNLYALAHRERKYITCANCSF